MAWIYLKDADIQVTALPSQPLRLVTSGLIHIMIRRGGDICLQEVHELQLARNGREQKGVDAQ